MSYLSQPTTNLDYGVVKIGNNINVLDGIISLMQDVSPTADVSFNTIDAIGDIKSNGHSTVTSVTPSAGGGISISDVIGAGPSASFKVSNTGVLKLTAGSGVSLSANTGEITISSVGADLISVYGTTTSYTATKNDEYIGVNSVSAVTITLPNGAEGRVYTIKDEHGQGSGKITIKPQTGEKVDNSASYIISVPYQSVSVVFRAGQWRVI